MIGVLHDDLETLNPLNLEPYTLDHNKTELNLAGHPQATNNFDGHYDRLALGLSKSPGLFLFTSCQMGLAERATIMAPKNLLSTFLFGLPTAQRPLEEAEAVEIQFLGNGAP